MRNSVPILTSQDVTSMAEVACWKATEELRVVMIMWPRLATGQKSVRIPELGTLSYTSSHLESVMKCQYP